MVDHLYMQTCNLIYISNDSVDLWSDTWHTWLRPNCAQLWRVTGPVGERLHFEDLPGVLGWAACHLAVLWSFNGRFW